MMMTTTMMMPPAKKARHNGYSYLETDRFFLNSSGGSGLGHDGFSPRSIRQSSHGSQMARELSADREEFRVLGPHPSSQARAVPPQGPSPRTVFHPSQEISKPSGFSLDFSEVGPGSSTQRTSRAFDMAPPSLRVDTIEFSRRTTTTPSRGAEANDAPLDLSTLNADNLLRRTPDDDQTFSRSGNSIPFTGRSSSGGYDSRSGSDGGQRQMEETSTPQLPLFVNLENSRLESIQLGLQSRRGHDTAEQESDETKLSDPTGSWERMMDCETESDVEPPRRQKKTIDRLRAHIERRQEARPASGTAYASLSKHLAAIEATGNRYEAVHGMTFGELQEAKATRSKTSFRSMTEADAQGRSYTHFNSEKEIPIRNPEEVPDQQKRSLSGLAIGGLQQKLHDQRLKETKLCLQNGTLRNREPVSDSGQCYAVTLENDSTSRKGQSSGVALRRHPTGHSHMSDHTLGQTQTDIQLQDWILAATQSALHPSKFPNFNASIHTTEVTPFTCAWRPSRPEAEPEPDSPSSHSLPDFSRGSNLAVSTQSQVLRRPASIDTGFPSSDKRLAMNDVAVMVTDRGGNGGGRTLETCSPDQSTNYRNYSADNLPSIIASARLDDDCEFISSYAETPKGTMARNHPHHPIDKSPNASFHNRRHTVLNGSVGTGLSSSPEPPSSTFEDEPVADKSKGEDNNIKATESAIPCKICQDVANGFHYGVWSCEGCKAFFKRSITGSAKYVCPADNNCTINRLRKKSCQACRLRKCYEYGMSPGNCRGENGSRIRKRKLQEADRKEDSTNSANGDDRRMNSASIQNLSGNVLHPVPTVHHNFHNHPTVNEPASGPVSILQHLLAVERPIRFAEFVDVRTSMDGADSERIQLLTSITKLVNLQLMDVVTWSRSLPGFNAVNLNIRTHLLVSSWSEILLLTSAFYSLQCTNAIAMAPNLHLTKERCEVIGMTALYNRLMPIVKSFQQLALTHSEMLLMQALLLVNADLTASQLIPRLDGLRASLMRSWHQSCAGSQGQGFVDYDRISRLLMLLPHIRHCSLLFQRFLSELKRDGRIPFSGFLEEVTDGRHDLHQVSVLELLVEEEADL